jgi:hypothetical protein
VEYWLTARLAVLVAIVGIKAFAVGVRVDRDEEHKQDADAEP